MTPKNDYITLHRSNGETISARLIWPESEVWKKLWLAMENAEQELFMLAVEDEEIDRKEAADLCIKLQNVVVLNNLFDGPALFGHLLIEPEHAKNKL